MQKVPLETQVNFALPIFKSMNSDISFDDILFKVEQKIHEFGGNFKQSEIILLMKYIGYYELLNNNPVPDFFSQNSKKPISSEKGALIEKLIAKFDSDASFIIEKSASAEKNIEEPSVETVNQNELDDGLKFSPLLLTRVDALELSVRSTNCLKNSNIVYIGDLVQNTEAEMLRTPNFGRSSLYEIRKVLSHLDLHFGMYIEDWPPDNVEELTKKYQNLTNLQNANIEAPKKNGSVTVEDLSDEKLEVIFSKITAVDFSARLKNVLSNLQIEAVGQILLVENLKYLGITASPLLPNYGRNSLAELKSFLKEQDLNNISLSSWPSRKEIETLIQNRKLFVGRCFAKIAISETIEGEARDIFESIVNAAHKEGIFRRLGIEGECIPWTLQEVGDQGFENGVTITRERVRQIQARYANKLNEAYIMAPKCTEVAAFINDFSFISESPLKEFLDNKKYTKASDPISLLLRLRDYGFCNFSHKIVEIRILNSRFLVKEEYEETFINFVETLRKKMYGAIFVNLNTILNEAIKEEDHEKFYSYFTENVDHLKNIVVCKKEEKIFIAKRALRLASTGRANAGGRTNSLVSTLALIFSICSSVNLRVLHKAISRDRKINEEISLDFLQQYLEACPFLKLDGERVICIKRPLFTGKITNDYKIIDVILEHGSSIIDTTQLIPGLVQRGLSTNSARVLSVVSPFLVSLKKGNYRNKGIFRLICDIEDLDIINYQQKNEASPGHTVDGETKFKIPNNPPLRATGRATLPKLEIDEGEYQVYDDEDNYLVDVQVRGKMILGLKFLAIKNPDSELNLSFSEGRFVFT